MTNEVLETLNEEQIIALKQIDGAVLVTAGAGSGKTRLLTHRITYLIENFHINPENILAITFTNKAANEMKNRIEKMCEQGRKVWISTFHSMCVRILRENIHKLDPRFNRNFSIYSDTESDKIIKALLSKRNIADDKIKKQIMFHLSNMKNNNKSLNSYREEISFDKNCNMFIAIMTEYQNTLLESNALDFDDLLVKTYELFSSCPDVIDYYSNRFKYILVDEFQDTNLIQYDLVKMLSRKHGNIFVVGDEDQCIYTWRGANFKNISNFRKDFQNVSIFKLEQNYRSTKTILNCANNLIKHNKQRIDKTLWSNADLGAPIEHKQLYDEQNEADFIAGTIHYLVENKGYSYSDFAILLRLNALSFPFEEKLLSYNIPHKIYGGFKFYERAEIKNVLAYLRLFINPKDDQAFLRIINFPKRGIGETSCQKILEIAKANKISMLEAVLDANKFGIHPTISNKLLMFTEIYKKLQSELEISNLDEFVQKVVDKFGIKFAFNINNDDDTDKLMNIDQLLLSIQNYIEKNPDDNLNDYLQSVSLISDIDSMAEDGNVIVATVHAVKGLEFRCVFLAGLEEKIFPISRAFGDDNQMEEERRLMYVGITRAKEKLFLTHCKTRFLYGHRDYMSASRFLSEIGFANKFETKPVINSNASRTAFSQVDYIKNVLSGTSSIAENKKKVEYHIGQMILHLKFGVGTIVAIDEEERTADIDFNKLGVKTLMIDIAPLKIIK